MTTYTALTTLPGGQAAQALGEALEDLPSPPSGVGVFEIEDGSGRWEVGAYFDAPPDAVALDLLAAVHGGMPFAVSRLDDRDWVAQVRRELSPVEAGRFVVHGGHDAHRIPVHKIALRIEAAMAFGTGHHATTQGCLVLLDRLARQGVRPRRIADIGCGTGVLAMAAARVWRSVCVATDIDEVAVATARENVAANALHPWVRTGRAAGVRGALIRAFAPYDLISANILAGPLKQIAPDLARHLAPGGRAVLSGLLSEQAAGVRAVYEGAGLTETDRVEIAGWTSLVLRRGRGIHADRT